MNSKLVLLSSAAAIALTSSAWANQGDTYISLFGGFSSGPGADIDHFESKTSYDKVTEFAARGTAATALGILPRRYFTKVKFTESGTTVSSKSVLKSLTRIGTAYRFYQLSQTIDIAGELGSGGWVVGAAMGVELYGGLRGEAEVAFRRFDFEDGAVVRKDNLYRRLIRDDAFYNYQVGIQTGTRDDGFTGTTETGVFQSSSRVLDNTRVRYGTNLPAKADGELTSFSFMANLWYDFPLGDSGFTPFVGGGIGLANLTMSYDFKALAPITQFTYNNIGTSKTTGPGTTVNTHTVKTTATTMHTPVGYLKDDDAVFAYQFGAGIGYEFESGLRLAAQYRYFATTDGDFGAISQNVESSDVIFSISFPLGN